MLNHPVEEHLSTGESVHNVLKQERKRKAKYVHYNTLFVKKQTNKKQAKHSSQALSREKTLERNTLNIVDSQCLFQDL